jgi:hypothetical protein
MTDRLLTPQENNIIDATRKLASFGVHHNFHKNPDVIAFNSALANDMFRDITGKSEKLSIQLCNILNGREDVLEWLNKACCGYYILIDSNIFFELDADRSSFIIQFTV